jgi:HEAT repeat protein
MCFAVRADAPDQVLKNLKDSSPRVRQLAAEAAGQQKIEAAVAPLGELLRDKDGGVRSAAAGALGQIGAKAVPVLVVAIGDEDTGVKLLALTTLGQIGPEAKEAVAALLGARKDKDVDVRIHAAFALGKIGPGAKAALPALFDAAKDTGNVGPLIRTQHVASGVMEAAVDAALKIDPTCVAKLVEAALPTLTAALKDKEQGKVMTAAAAIGRLGEPARKALPELEAAAKTAYGHALLKLIEARIGVGDDFTRAYLDVIGDRSAPIAKRQEAMQWLVFARPPEKVAARALGGIGPDAKEAVPALKKLLQEQEKQNRVWGAYALARVTGDTKTYVAQVLELWDSDGGRPVDSSSAESYVVEALALLGPDARAARDRLLTALENEKALPGIRKTAAEALRKMSGEDAAVLVPKSIALLERRTNGDKRDDMCHAVIELLGALGPKARDAVPHLQRIAENDEQNSVADAAAAALEKLTGKE